MDGSLLQRQLHRTFEMSQQEADGFERRTRLFRLMNGIEPEWLRRSGIDEQGLRLSRSLNKAQYSLPLSMVDKLGKEFTSMPHTQQRDWRLFAWALAGRG